MLTAVAVALSTFSVPIGASRCFPVQHMVNVMAGVFFGAGLQWPSHFVLPSSEICLNGKPSCIPGSMVGALLCGLAYRCTGKLTAACAAEIIGTGFLGAALCYPVAAVLMGKRGCPVFLCSAVFDEYAVRNCNRCGSDRCSLPFRAFGYLKRQIAAKK